MRCTLFKPTSGSPGFAVVDIIVGIAIFIPALLLLAGLAGAGNRILTSGVKEVAVYTEASRGVGTIVCSLVSSRYSQVQTWKEGTLFPSRVRVDSSSKPIWDEARAIFLDGTRLEIADRSWDWSTGVPCRPDSAGCTGWRIYTLMDGVVSYTVSRARSVRSVNVTLTISTPAGKTVRYDLSVHPEH